MVRARSVRGAHLSGRRLPLPIRTRLADTRRHAAALKSALEATSAAEFLAAATGDDPEPLRRVVYPLERGFEILENYVIELARLGLAEAGAVPDSSGPAVLRQLVELEVIPARRCETLAAIHGVRNRMQHDYPDVRAQAVFDAATDLLRELPLFFGDYARWLRGLGFGS